MNREIKFRAWDKQGRIFIREESFAICLNGGLIQRNSKGEIIFPNELRYKIMQFTGLHDKNGKEIYEGDILLDDTEGYSYDFVEWNPTLGGFATGQWFSPKDLVDNAEGHEVAGNIYEDSELLKLSSSGEENK